MIRSDGSYVRDYIYVEDAAAAYILLAEAMATDETVRGEAFNFSTEARYTVLGMTRRILALMESNLEPDVRNEASNEIRCQYLSAAKARLKLGWEPRFDLDAGLKRTIEWYSGYFRDER